MKTNFKLKLMSGCACWVLAFAFGAVGLPAANIDWTNTSGGYWDASANWSAGVPGAADTAQFGAAGTYTATITNAQAVDFLRMYGSGNPTVLINMPDSLTAFRAGATGVYLGYGASTFGTLALQQGTLLMTNAGGSAFVLGANRLGAQGTFSMLGGVAQNENIVRLGYYAGSTGIILMTSGNFTVTNASNGNFIIGDHSGDTAPGSGLTNAYGLVTLSNGVFKVRLGTVGNAAGAVGDLRIFGGTNDYTGTVGYGALVVGQSAGSTGSVLVAGTGVLGASGGSMTFGSAGRGLLTASNGGVVNPLNHMRIGDSAGGSGEMDVNGGAVLINGGNLLLGLGAGATGSVVVTSGSLSVANPSYTLSVGNVSGGVGNLTVGGGLLTAYTLNVGASSGSWGSMTVTGGVVTVTNALTVGAVSGATGSLAVAGGALRLTGGNGYLEARYGSIDLTGGSTLASSVTATNSGRVLIGNGALLEANSLIAGGSGGAITNNGGIFQFTTTALGVTTNTPGSVVMTNGVISYRNVGAANIASLNVSYITFQGQNAFRLDGSSNAAVAAYTFDNSLGAANYATLQLRGTNAMWQSANLNLGAGGALAVTGAVNATVSGVVTNQGTISVLNSTVTWQGNVVIGGSYFSDPSTNIFTSNVTVTASGSLSGSNGDLFVFQRDFINQSTNRANFNLANAAVLFTNGAGATTHTLNLTNSGAVDMGSNWLNVAQLATNFSIGTLSISLSNQVTLTGLKSGATTNALYVGWLDLSAWNTNAGVSLTNALLAALVLPDINLYYDASDSRNAYLRDARYALWGGGGLLIPIPEPSALTLTLAAGALSMLILKRKSRRL